MQDINLKAADAEVRGKHDITEEEGRGSGAGAGAGAGAEGTAMGATRTSGGAVRSGGADDEDDQDSSPPPVVLLTTIPATPPAAAGATLPLPSLPPPSSSSASTSALASASESSIVHAVLLISFDHTLGPLVEFSYPPRWAQDEQLARDLPFLALPDGAHAREEDYSYFHLYLPSLSPSTIFGISCNRQIQADALLAKDASVTRSTVQKAIVVLASKPIFGPLRDKLGVITRTFFAQRDFADKSLLVDLWNSFGDHPQGQGQGQGHRQELEGRGKSRGRAEGQSSEMTREVETREAELGEQEREGGIGEIYMGTSLRELVYKFRTKTLMLLKLLLLQRKVMFYSATLPVETLCTFQYSLVALVPALLMHLDDCSSPLLSTLSSSLTPPTSLRTSSKTSLIRYLGLPLHLFGPGAFFQPYLPLQQIDLLPTSSSYLVGTTNSIFQLQRAGASPIDVLVRPESGALEIRDPKLESALKLTMQDRKWMDEVVGTVEATWDEQEPSRVKGGGFLGSEDFLRGKFEEYICSLLACIKFNDFLQKGDKAGMLLSGNELASYNITSFNEAFIRGFKATQAFKLWDGNTDSAIFDLVEPKHPMEGKTNPIEDVGIRLAHGLHDLHLQENLAPTREAISAAVTSGGESLASAYSYLSKTVADQRRASWGAAEPGQGQPGMGQAPVGTALLAGAEAAKTGAASLATGIGSFLSSRRGLFAAGTGSATAAGTGKAASEPNSRAPSPSTLGGGGAGGSASSGTSPTPPSSGFGSFLLRPLSTNPLATSAVPGAYPPTPSTTAASGAAAPSTPSPSASSAAAGLASNVGGFFGSIRKSFLDSSASSSATATTPQGKELTGLKELELHDPLSVPRDLDAEYAAKEERMRKRRTRELERAEAKLEGRI